VKGETVWASNIFIFDPPLSVTTPFSDVQSHYYSYIQDSQVDQPQD